MAVGNTRRKVPRPFFKLRSLVAISLISAFLLTGCSPLYVIRAAYEEGKILWRRQPIAEMLQDSDLEPQKRDKIQLVLDVREYARNKLNFRVGGSYASYSYVDRSALTYVLMAAPKTSLVPHTWWFPFVGHVPYKGFFSEQDARAEARSFEARGYDTFIRTVPAFSTLGWFDDPLLAHLLAYDKVTLAEIVFHELFHNTLFVKGGLDFNESLANFFGSRAAIDFFRDRYGEDSPEHRLARQAWSEDIEFSSFITKVGGSLRELYAKGLPPDDTLRLREEIFERSKQEWASRIADRPQHHFRGYLEQPLNSAVIVHYLLYLTELELFESFYRIEGGDLGRMVTLIKSSVPDGSNPFVVVRRLVRRGNS